MKKWLDEKIDLSYRELFDLLLANLKSYDEESDVDMETLSFDKIMSLYKERNDGEFPYSPN